MEVSELYQLTEWFKVEVGNRAILKKYDELLRVINQNLNRANNQPAQSFEDQRQDLISSLSEINLYLLTQSQIAILDSLNVGKCIGQAGIYEIEYILTNILDIAHVSESLSQLRNELAGGIESVASLRASLLPILEDEPELDEGLILTRVTFSGEAQVSDINDLKDWATKWFDIGRGLAMSNGLTPEDVQIVGGGRGSLILELAINATLAIPLLKIVNMTLDAMVKVQQFRLKSQEIRDIKETTPNLEEELEQDAVRWEDRAEKLLDSAVENISESVKEHLSNHKKDANTELNKAIKTLVDFLSKGGDVDCVIQDDPVDEDGSTKLLGDLKVLREELSDIRALKQTLLLEYSDEEYEEGEEYEEE